MANQEMKICAEEALNGNLEDCARLLFPQEGETMPKLRFSGFEGEWERKLLSECLEISEEKNTDNKFGIEDVLSVSDDYGVVNQIELLGRSYAGKSVSGYKILRPGQIVYTKSPLKAKPYGIVKQNTGEAGIVSVLYAVYNTKEGVAPEYIHYYFDPAWRLNAYMRPLVNKGAKNTMNISDETALTGYIMIPKDIEEQRRIATYLRSLDEQIAIQQQQLERLKKMKQSCLGLLFADNQSITPPLRFKGFSGEWKRVKLVEIANKFNYGINAAAKPYDGYNKYLRITDIDEDMRVFNKDNLTSPEANNVEAYLLQEGDIVLARTGASVGKSYFYDANDGRVVFAGFLIRVQLKDTVCPRFIFTCTQTENYYKYIRMVSQRSGQPGVNTREYGDYSFLIPPTIEEQRCIANFFERLDKRIVLQSQQVEKLKQVKKACLNQFIA